MNDPSSILDRLSEEAVWQLEQACCQFESAWQSGRRPCVEDFLVGVEGAEQFGRIYELVRLDIHYRRGMGELPRPQDYETRFPDAATILGQIFVASAEPRNETIDAPERTGSNLRSRCREDNALLDEPTSGPGQSSPRACVDLSHARFKPVRFHASGGLGQVFVAKDAELQREVALKEIRQEHADRDESRRRFVLEAQTTGRLEHPGIVPVYGLGVHADGRPFYAMRFIQGESLRLAIERFHAPGSGRFESIEFRQLVSRFVAVCQALAYAHSRGVLHRDVKPDNIMLGKFGETLLVDWGVAKVLGQQSAQSETIEPRNTERVEFSAGETEAGQILGTPAFMSPEQAAGNLPEQQAVTDVYGLGATLYAMLANRPPFQGKVADVLNQVKQGDYTPARQVNALIPMALDAVCRKAMAQNARERYRSALDLAGDLERWLADEPVSAIAESRGVRLRRWMRKHPKPVTATGVLLLATVVGLTIGAGLLERSNQQARENFEMAQKEANQFLEAVGDDALLDEPGLRPLRQRLLLDMLDYYRTFLTKRPEDSRARQQMGEANRQLAELYGQIGMDLEGDALLLQAVTLYQQLLETAPTDRKLRFGMARIRQTQADFHIRLRNPAPAKEELDQAITSLEALRNEEPRNGEFRSLLATCYNLRSAAQTKLGHLEMALTDNKLAVETLPDATSADSREDERARLHILDDDPIPGMARFASQAALRKSIPLRAHILATRGNLLVKAGRTGESLPLFEMALVAQRFCVKANPRASQPQGWLTDLLLNIAHAEMTLGRPLLGEPALEEATQIARRLLEDYPRIFEFRASYALALGYRGQSVASRGRTVAATETLGEAIQRLEELLESPSLTRDQRACYGQFLYCLGSIEIEAGKVQEGVKSCERGRDLQAALLAEKDSDWSLLSDLLNSREVIVYAGFLAGRAPVAAALNEQRQMLQERQALARRCAAPRFLCELANSAVCLAHLLVEARLPAEALAVLENVLPDHQQLVHADEGRVENRLGERVGAGLRPSSVPSPHREDAWRLGAQATAFGRQAPEPTNRQLRRTWARALACKASVLAHLGRIAEANEAIRNAIEVTKGLLRGDREWSLIPASPASVWALVAQQVFWQEPAFLYDLASFLALEAAWADKNRASALAAEAVQTLQACINRGFDNPRRLLTDVFFAGIRDRPDFQRLVLSLQNSGTDGKPF